MTNKKTYLIKKVLLGLTIILLSLPVIQHITNIPRMRGLKGNIEQVDAATFKSEDWFSGEYAKATDKYFKHNMGYRPNLVRMDNQLAYSLFDETRAKNIVVGKDFYLYEQNYIDAYTGKDFLGAKVIKDRVKEFKFIQDSLAVLGKHLLVVLVAGKASFFPEYIPDDLMLETDSTNYIFYKNELKKQAVHHIDFMDWFLENKGKLLYPLYPKTGTHWSEYGMALAADSLINHVEQLNEFWDLPELYWNDIEYTKEIKQTDNDIELALNLITTFPNHKMAYPKILFNKHEKDTANIIMISDSFFWRMLKIGVIPECFPNGQLWYYNRLAYRWYPSEGEKEIEVKDLSLEQEINQADVIIMMATEGNLHRFPWGARERLLKYFERNKDLRN